MYVNGDPKIRFLTVDAKQAKSARCRVERQHVSAMR